MAGLNDAVVRDFFELHGFFVRQPRKFLSPSRGEEEEVDFLVSNPRPQPVPGDWPFELSSEWIPSIAQAVVLVKAWHGDTFTTNLLERVADHFRCLEPAALQPLQRSLAGDAPLTKLLILPGLPQGAEARAQSVEWLRARGIDAVLPFRVLLADLIRSIEAHRSYERSDFLQALRVLKLYGLFREPQLELFKPARRRRTQLETTPSPPPPPDPPAAAGETVGSGG